MKTFFYSILILGLSLSIFSCNKDENTPDTTPKAGVLELQFDNIAIVDGVQRQLSTVSPGSVDYSYKNEKGQDFNISLLRYYITNVKLTGPNGESYEDKVEVDASGTKGIYLIDEANLATGTFLLSDIPAGNYNKLTFTVGVEEEIVTEGAAGGVLDPASCNMFWNWNAGYVALKFEGQAAASQGGANGEAIKPDNANGIVYHIGGWKDVDGTALVYNNKTISLDFDTSAKVEDGQQPHVHLTFDVLKLFKGVNTVDFTGNVNVHKPVDGKVVAANIPAAFAYDHIHQ